MTPFSKTVLVVGLTVVAVGGVWYQASVSRHQKAEIAELHQQIAQQRRRTQQLRAERDDLLARATPPLPASSPAFATGDAAFDAHMESVLARVNQLRKWLAQNSRQKIPEFEFLQDTDWIDAVSGGKNFDVHSAAHVLRDRARWNFVALLQGALKDYGATHQGQLPGDLAELAPFFVSPVSDAILRRYEMRASGPRQAVPEDLPIISEKVEALGDPSEQASAIFANGGYGNEFFGGRAFLFPPPDSPKMANAVSKANQAFRMTHQGAYSTDATQLLPYFKNPADAADFAEAQSQARSRPK
jgi:hypothetical protein